MRDFTNYRTVALLSLRPTNISLWIVTNRNSAEQSRKVQRREEEIINYRPNPSHQPSQQKSAEVFFFSKGHGLRAAKSVQKKKSHYSQLQQQTSSKSGQKRGQFRMEYSKSLYMAFMNYEKRKKSKVHITEEKRQKYQYLCGGVQNDTRIICPISHVTRDFFFFHVFRFSFLFGSTQRNQPPAQSIFPLVTAYIIQSAPGRPSRAPAWPGNRDATAPSMHRSLQAYIPKNCPFPRVYFQLLLFLYILRLYVSCFVRIEGSPESLIF